MTGAPPPWVWDELPPDVFRQRWHDLVSWVDWLADAYAPWVVLAPCWPAHDGLRDELVLFWYWHAWLTTAATDPTAGIRWHDDLRRAATAWRELSTCEHRPARVEYERIIDAARTRRDAYVAALLDGHDQTARPPRTEKGDP